MKKPTWRCRKGRDMQVNHSEDLRLVACNLAEEIREGRWQHVKDLRLKPAAACMELIDELRSRCPGHDLSAYQRALADGMFGTR